MKLLIGGGPCTHWSIARAKDLETKLEGLGWELFKNYLIARDKYEPEYFLYENNKSMAEAIRDQITAELGVESIMIKSALLSAQSRKRLYWTNIPGVKQPEDRGIVLRDILENGVPMQEKAYTLKAQYYKNGIANFITNGGFGATAVAEPMRIGTIESGTQTNHDSKPFRVYSPDGKGVTIQGEAGGYGAKTGLYAVPIDPAGLGGAVYPITFDLECKRLQTVPDSYIFPVSDTQAYRQLGNGWTVDVIAHILSHCPGLTERPLEVLSMYDSMSCGRTAGTGQTEGQRGGVLGHGN